MSFTRLEWENPNQRRTEPSVSLENIIGKLLIQHLYKLLQRVPPKVAIILFTFKGKIQMTSSNGKLPMRLFPKGNSSSDYFQRETFEMIASKAKLLKLTLSKLEKLLKWLLQKRISSHKCLQKKTPQVITFKVKLLK